MKRNNLRNLFCLLLIMLALYLLDNTKLNRYIGYSKVKEYIKEDIDVFALGKGFFGDKVFSFYNTEQTVSSSVIKVIKIGSKTIVYQNENHLYSSFIGSVLNIYKYDDSYSVLLSTYNGKILISNIKEVCVKLYQKVEADTLIGMIDTWYYYEEI